jgi:hypothetical protein
MPIVLLDGRSRYGRQDPNGAAGGQGDPYPWAMARRSLDVLSTAGLDTAHTTWLVLLDPTQFSLRDGSEQATVR